MDTVELSLDQIVPEVMSKSVWNISVSRKRGQANTKDEDWFLWKALNMKYFDRWFFFLHDLLFLRTKVYQGNDYINWKDRMEVVNKKYVFFNSIKILQNKINNFINSLTTVYHHISMFITLFRPDSRGGKQCLSLYVVLQRPGGC